MATESHAHDHADDGAVHAHISSPLFYTAIFIALVILTITTVGQSYFDLGRLNIIAVILIATMKASLVVTFFMHLRHDNKFNALIFICGLMFIGVFFAYTFNDVGTRGELDADQNVIVNARTGENAPGHFDHIPLVQHPAEGAPGHETGGAAPAGTHTGAASQGNAPSNGGGAGSTPPHGEVNH
jgi:cytochrome c oxidase subunit 4